MSQMITKANLSGITLMVRPTGHGRLSVTLCAESTDWKAEDQNLKAALSQPLNIEGDVVEIENKILSDLNQYSESFVRGAIASNADSVCAKTDQAVKSKTKKAESKNESPSDEVDNNEITIGEEVADTDFF